MRYILLLIFALITTYTSAQIQYLGSPTTTVRNRGNFVSDSLFYLPKRSKAPSDTAAIRYQISDSTVYVWTGGSWRSIGRAGASFLAISDTASMLTPYIRHAGNGLTKTGQALAVDTFTIATRNRAQKQVDSLGGIMVNTTTGQNISGNKIFANDITFNAQVITKLLTLPNKDGLNGYSYIRSKSTGVNLRDIYFPNDSGTVVLDKTIGSYISSNISGTTNYVPKFTASSTIGNSQIFDNGTNVGIGTTSPSYKLQVIQSTQGIISLFRTVDGADNPGLTIETNSAGTMLMQVYSAGGASSLQFGTNASERMRITSAGNVGIGTSTPDARLDVANTITSDYTSAARFRNSDAGAGNFRNVGIEFWDRYTTVNAAIIGARNAVSGNWQGDLVFKNAQGASPSTDPSTLTEVMRFNGQSKRIQFLPDGTERMRLTSDGELLINTSTDAGAYALQVSGSIYNTAAAVLAASGSNDVRIGSTSGRQISGIAAGMLQVWDNPGNYGGITIHGQNANNAFGNYLQFIKSRGTGNTLLQNGDDLGGLYFAGADGTNYIRAGAIRAIIDATPGTNDMPTSLVFETTADGATAPTERVRMTSAGNVHIGATSDALTDAGRTLLSVNGSSNSIISMRSGGTLAGFLYANGTSSFDIVSNNIPMRFAMGASVTERMRLQSDGELLIGTTTDAGAYALQVAGSIYNTTGAVLAASSGNVLIGSGSATNKLEVRDLTTSTAIVVDGGPSSSGIFSARNNGTENGYFSTRGDISMVLVRSRSWTMDVGTEAAQALTLTTNSAERVRISSGGNVGIGTTSPSQPLHVNGNILTAAPSGGTAKPFKIGAAATVSPTSPNRTIEIEIDGVTYYLHAKTTNN